MPRHLEYLNCHLIVDTSSGILFQVRGVFLKKYLNDYPNSFLVILRVSVFMLDLLWQFWSGEQSLTWGGLRAFQNLRRILVVYTYMYIRLIEIKIISVYTRKTIAREEERGNKCRFKIQTIQSILMLDSYFRTEDKKPWIWMKLWKFCMITNDFQDLETYSIHHDRLKFIGRKRTIFSTLLHD